MNKLSCFKQFLYMCNWEHVFGYGTTGAFIVILIIPVMIRLQSNHHQTLLPFLWSKAEQLSCWNFKEGHAEIRPVAWMGGGGYFCQVVDLWANCTIKNLIWWLFTTMTWFCLYIINITKVLYGISTSGMGEGGNSIVDIKDRLIGGLGACSTPKN